MAYQHLFFDLDHTLWDHHRNANETLKDLFVDYDFDQNWEFTADQFTATFHQVNFQLWDRYRQGSINQDFIRKERFPKVMAQLGVAKSEVPEGLAEEYLQRCPRKPHLMPYTLEILDYLMERYSMSIITNGFSEIQETKLSCSGLSPYFSTVVTSEVAGKLKPHPQIFNFALSMVRASGSECIMIGDNPVADIAGARSAGIDQIYYDPANLNEADRSTFRVDCLTQLKDLL